MDRITPLPNKQVGDLYLVELFIVLLVIWILVDLWVIFFRDLARRTFGFDERNTLHAFAFAFAVTAILVGFVILVGLSFQESLVGIGALPKLAESRDAGQDDDEDDEILEPDLGIPSMSTTSMSTPSMSTQNTSTQSAIDYTTLTNDTFEPDEIVATLDKKRGMVNIDCYRNKKHKKSHKKRLSKR